MLYSIDQGEVPEKFRRRYASQPAELVVQPKSIEELQQVFRAAAHNRVPVVLRGSASSGFGAVLPTRGGMCVDLGWFRRILKIDPNKNVAVVESGVRWSDLMNRGVSLRGYPTNIFSTVGGWIATGGYGVGSAKYGHLREQIEWMRVILPDGTDMTYRPDEKEFGYFFGSDGQLGVVAEAALKTREEPKYKRPLLATFATIREAVTFVRNAFEAGVRPFYGNVWTAARMREKNHLTGRHDFEEKPTVLLQVESKEEEEKILAMGVRPAEHWKAQLCWEDRYFPIRAKQLGPGLLAAELLFPTAVVPEYVEAAEALGHKYGWEVVIEAQIVGADKAVVIATFLYDARGDAAEHVHASAFAMKLAATGLHMGAQPYNLGLWYAPFAELKFPNYKEIKAYKRKVDPLGLFNPGKSLSRRFGYTMFVKAFATFPWLPPWFASKRKPAGARPGAFDWKSAWDVCSRCAACVAHCPAYLAFGDERVTARGKMFLMANLDRIPAEEAQNVMLCMHCKACTEVCQSQIQLEDAFFDLERRVAERHGKDIKKIERFLNRVEELKLMEELPMAKREPQWVRSRLHLDV